MEQSFLHTKKILLVDDELELRKIVIDILSDDGFSNIIDAGTVQTGLIFAMHEKPDLAILDVMLPDGDGFSLMKKLRTFTNIPIIFLTAKDEAADKLAGLGLGALCEALWGNNPFGYENSLNAHIRRIREKIETDPSKPVSLITIKGLGYKLNARK
ncbi:MAG TPA: hypothetical protein DCZ40_00770 [Lachnospiraceae bacterium]|nr:hypothetical protein [Lachnospiraceae bacterium]